MAKKKNRNAIAQPAPASKVESAVKTANGNPGNDVTPRNLSIPTQDDTDMSRNVEDSWLGIGLGLNQQELDALKNYPADHRELYTVIKSIYGDTARLDYGRKTVWGKHLLGFEITVQALDNIDIFARLDVELPPEYPKIGATFHLIELEPSSEALKQDLADIMNAGAKTWENDVQMVSNILAEICEKLNDVHAEQEMRAQGASLGEERATTKSAAQADAISREQLALRQKEAEIRAKEAELAQKVESHRKRRQLLSSSQSRLEDEKGVEEDYPDHCVVFNQDITVYDSKKDTDVSFRAVIPMEVLYEREGKRVMTVLPYRNGTAISLPLVLKEVRLPPVTDSEAAYLSTLNKIETNLLEVKSFNHSAIVKIYDFKLEQISDTMSTSHWEFTILTERANGGPLPAMVAMSGGVKAPELRRYARSILDAFEFYDRKGYVHPAIHAHNILFFGEEHKVYSAKLSDGYGSALRKLVDQLQYGKTSTELSKGPWAPPELANDRPIRNNKTCIFELGIVLLQMGFGNDLAEQYTSPLDALERGKLDPDFDHLISTMCLENPKKRPTAFQLQSHQYFQSRMPSVFQAENKAFRAAQSSLDSKWAEDWEPVGKLGKGGFGTVFKARNRMDGHFYAVKQMKCKTIKDMNEIKGEVRMLASLNHPTIVRYFNAWTEDDRENQTDTEESTVPTDPRSFAPPLDSAAPPSNLFALSLTGHDFMDPSLAQFSDTDEEEEEAKEGEDQSSDDGNIFGYQSARTDSDDEDSEAVESEDEGNQEDEDPSDPFALQAVANYHDKQENLFESESPNPQKEKDHVPSRPQPFKVAGHEPSMFRRPPQYFDKSSTLYIQMELCETGTLSDLIRNGLPDTIPEIWRLFRLLLDGLDHIHKMKVVHRDLKPMNIFIDSQKMPKIGDFGLASPSQATVDGEKVATHIAGPQSKGVGTVYYIAPELEEKKGTGEYSAKADMFALGVILFEMCFPFRTVVERFNWLASINRDPTKLPDRFDEANYKVQGRIIRSLLDHNAEKRPSARDLLLDPEIPEPLETEKEGRFVQRLIHGDPEQLQRVMEAFMSKTADRSQLLAYAHDGKDELGDQYTVSWIAQKMEEVFRTHGGVESSRETVFPAEELYQIEQKPVRFIDAAGFTVQLPHDLTVPFARTIAVQKPEFGKFFCYGTVFRQREVGVEPLRIPEVDFDLVSYSARDLSLKDAQVISVLDDCMTKLTSLFVRSFSIVISHDDLLDLILGACGVPEGRFEGVKRLLSNLNAGKQGVWRQVQQDLQMSVGLAATTVAAIGQFNVSSTFEDMRQHVLAAFRKLKKDDSALKAARPLSRLQEVDGCLRRLRVRTTVLFCPLSLESQTLYKGSLMFRCIENKSRRIVAAGGRYDALIRSYQSPTNKTSARAAGVRINILDLARLANFDAQKQNGKSAKSKNVLPAVISPRVDVVVTSFDEETLRTTCLEILRNILDAGLSTELSELFTNMDELEKCYSQSTRYWVVIVRPTSGNQKAIKVRSPSREETDVPASELIDHLRTEIGGGGGLTTSTAEPALRRTRSSHGASDRENVIILTPQHKSKKVNRAAIVDSARTVASELAENMNKNFKILAIDTDDETLQRMRNTRLSDGDSWRGLRHSVALNEREYIQEIQQQMQDWSNAGQEGAFLCNYKTKTCIVYDFGKSN